MQPQLTRGMAALLNTVFVADLAAARAVANAYRKTLSHRYGNKAGCPTGGVVVVFKNEVQGWVNKLRNPESWAPGCVAVEENGTCHIAAGGNAYDGATHWQAGGAA